MAYFYIVLSIDSQYIIVIDQHCFQSMISYNAYIRIFTTGKEIFSIEFQKIEFFLEYLRAIANIKSDFTQEVKKSGY